MEDKFGEFGPIYPHFKGKAKDAIKWLRKTKQGECPMSLYRSGVGYIDIVWGENDPKTNIGYGLKHIIEKHEESIKSYGFLLTAFDILKKPVRNRQA